MPGFINVPDAAHYWLTNGRVPLCLLDMDLSPLPALRAFPHQEELVAVDVEVCDGAIATIVPTGQAAVGDRPAVDLVRG